MMMVIAALFCGLNGCKSKESKKKPRTLHGTVDSIDMVTKTVIIEWFNDKTGKTMFLPGRVTPETEIFIDGKLADLSQVRTKDDVVVEGYQKGTDNVAVKVTITRATDKVLRIVKPTSTQPAGGKK